MYTIVLIRILWRENRYGSKSKSQRRKKTSSGITG